MRLTTFTDYALRVLIYLGTAPDGFATIEQIAGGYRISANHLMKVVHQLGQLGYVATVRGKGGGLRLARAPESINVGEVVRRTEDGFAIVECFEKGARNCAIAPSCVLKHALHEALDAFLEALDRYTLADLLKPRKPLAQVLRIAPPARARATAAPAR
ncbi:MAG: Rrf2 family transcriptional regulator [Betaproteobacteria bacterium]|nr:Rrf2 family transcriptional regulator [Betaproteobacteria bacterium]